jgi:hypothetical protein
MIVALEVNLDAYGLVHGGRCGRGCGRGRGVGFITRPHSGFITTVSE